MTPATARALGLQRYRVFSRLITPEGVATARSGSCSEERADDLGIVERLGGSPFKRTVMISVPDGWRDLVRGELRARLDIAEANGWRGVEFSLRRALDSLT